MITVSSHTARAGPGWSQPLQKCLWMDLGVVSYKLCDLEYDCEACPFDRAIREKITPSAQPRLGRAVARDDSERR